ncbi:MAG TPA: cobalamin-binding protein [Syntrophomonadaceae bacterium]|nr:cobalamin-binding protein [Syntrophomonadaceae bacterium]
MSLLDELKELVVKGDMVNAVAKTQEALDEGLAPDKLIDEALIAAMDVVGEMYKSGELFVPEMLVAAQTMQACMEKLEPLVAADELKSAGKVVIGTVKDDLHDIGKNLVAMMLRGAGFEVVDLGVDVAVEEFVAKVKELKPDILGMSALLTTTVPQMDLVIKALDEAGLRSQVQVIVGGAAVTPEFAKNIGADGYAPDAAGAVDWAKNCMISSN